jgi:hypothetical protein
MVNWVSLSSFLKSCLFVLSYHHEQPVGIFPLVMVLNASVAQGLPPDGLGLDTPLQDWNQLKGEW